MHAQGFEHRAHGAAGDDAGSGGRGAQQHAAGAVTPRNVVMERAAVAQRHADQPALRLFGSLANGLRHFARLSGAESDAAAPVADHDERGEAEAAPALHHLGDAVDADELVEKIAVAVVLLAVAPAVAAPAPASVIPGHVVPSAWLVRFAQKPRPASRAASASARTRP